MAQAAELSIAEAAKRLVQGELVAFPTETSWGLAADATSGRGVAALLRWKGRSADRPLSVLVEGTESLAALGAMLSPDAARLAAQFWPGPLTLVSPVGGDTSRRFAAGVVSERGTLGVRCSSHPDAAALAAEMARVGAGPVTATSLNRSGEASVASRGGAKAVCADADGFFLLSGEECGGGPPSSVVDCSTSPPDILREAALSRGDLESVLVPRRTAHAS